MISNPEVNSFGIMLHPWERSRPKEARAWISAVGILITGLGLALSAGDDYPLHLGSWMLGGLVLLFLGLGLILLHFFIQKD